MPRDNHFANARTLSVLLDPILLTLSAVTTAILFAWVLYYSSYGFNLADEGLYLNYIANPFAYAVNSPPSLFGFLYHWPFLWAAGDIAVLRVSNVTLTMALGWILSFLLIRRLWTAGWPQAAVLSAGIASLALYSFSGSWLTLSYYSLAFQSLLMVMTGLLLAERQGRIRQVLGWILVGVGGWCCFMAKPTTAAAIALVVMLYVVVLQRKSLLPMLVRSTWWDEVRGPSWRAYCRFFVSPRRLVNSRCPNSSGASDAALRLELDASEMRWNDFEYTCDRRRRNRQLISIRSVTRSRARLCEPLCD